MCFIVGDLEFREGDEVELIDEYQNLCGRGRIEDINLKFGNRALIKLFPSYSNSIRWSLFHLRPIKEASVVEKASVEEEQEEDHRGETYNPYNKNPWSFL